MILLFYMQVTTVVCKLIFLCVFVSFSCWVDMAHNIFVSPRNTSQQ